MLTISCPWESNQPRELWSWTIDGTDRWKSQIDSCIWIWTASSHLQLSQTSLVKSSSVSVNWNCVYIILHWKQKISSKIRYVLKIVVIWPINLEQLNYTVANFENLILRFTAIKISKFTLRNWLYPLINIVKSLLFQ